MSIIYMRLSKEKHSRLGTKQASFCEICLGYFQATNFSPNKTIFISIDDLMEHKIAYITCIKKRKHGH